MKRINIDIFIINTLLFLFPFIYISGFGSYNILRYFFFGTTALVLTAFTTYRFIKNKELLRSFLRSWYSYGLIVYLVSFFIVSIASIDVATSFFSSFERTDGFFAILFLSLFSLSIYSITATKGQKVIRQFLISSILGAVILSLFIFFSTEGFSLLKMKWLSDSRGGSLFGNSSVAAAYILWNIFFAIILFIKSENFKEKIFFASSFLILTFSPLFLNWHIILKSEAYSGIISFIGQARGALLGIIFGLIISAGIWLIFQKHNIKKYFGIGILSVIFIGIFLGGASLLNKNSLIHQKFIESTSETRFIFWDSAVKGFQEHPLLGVGPNNFSYSFHKFFNPRMWLPINGSEVLVDRTHNIFFETLVGGGILLVLSLFFFLSSIIIGLIKLGKREQLPKLEISLFIGALFGWLLQAQFVFDSIASLLMLFLVCGITYGYLVKVEDIKKQKVDYLSIKEKFIIIGIFTLVTFLFVYVIIFPIKKDRLMYKTYTTNLPLRTELWKNLSEISPMGDSNDSVTLFSKVVDSYDLDKQYVKESDIREKEIYIKEIDAVINYLSGLISQKDNYDLIFITARFYYLRMYITNDISESSFSKAQNLIQRAIELSPTDPKPYWFEAQLEIVKNNFSEAKNLLEKAYILEPKLLYTHNLILQFAKNINDKVYYEFALKRAKGDIPGFEFK